MGEVTSVNLCSQCRFFWQPVEPAPAWNSQRPRYHKCGKVPVADFLWQARETCGGALWEARPAAPNPQITHNVDAFR